VEQPEQQNGFSPKITGDFPHEFPQWTHFKSSLMSSGLAVEFSDK
jgi:hypothetical protein